QVYPPSQRTLQKNPRDTGTVVCYCGEPFIPVSSIRFAGGEERSRNDMNAISVSVLVCSILPVLSEAMRPAARQARTAMSPGAAVMSKQLWSGPIDPFTLSAAGRDLASIDLRAAIRPGDEWFEVPRPLAQPADVEPPSWAAHGFHEEDIRRSLGRQFDLERATINSKVVLIDPNANPYVPIRRSGWQT